MLRASGAQSGTRESGQRLANGSAADGASPGAERRPGPTRDTSWKEVEHLGEREAPEASASSSATASFSESADSRAIRIKDLDSGREYNVQQKYTIRDLNTGQLFALCKDDMDGPGSHEANGFPEHVTDFASGKQLSLEEFDAALGLRGRVSAVQPSATSQLSGPKPAGCKDIGAVQGESADDQPGATGGSVARLNGSDPSAKAKKSWLKRIQIRKGKAPAADTDASGSESSVDTPQADHPQSSLARNSGAASVSGRTPVRVSVHRKLHKELAGLSLVQSLQAHEGVVWAMKFSQNGKYLATAGQDAVVFVWEVASHRGPKSKADAEAGDAATQGNGHAAPATLPEPETAVFKAAPHRTYRGHKQDVLDVAWSKSMFLLTASMDKTVRLWHVSMDDCLRLFRHTDFVTALDFHPVDDKHFLSGSIDGKVRVWNIPSQNGRVVDYADVHEMVTAITFSADGGRAIVGTMKGKCRFYQCGRDFKLEYEAQIDVKNRRGKTSRGRKITGLQFLPDDPTKLLITSNDSRIRLYDGYTLRCKYKGLHNTNTQIRASFSPGGEFIICGSDNGSVYFWTTAGTSGRPAASARPDEPLRQEKSGAFESFHAHNDIATVAIFAPDGARRTMTPRSPAPPEKASEAVNRLGLRSKLNKEEIADAAVAGEAAIKSARAHGQVLLTAGYNGEIKVFENFAVPQWL